MSFLPKNEKKEPIETPQVFVIYGESMHGKSYMADEFPNPIIFNTDDNARAVETPSVSVYNGMSHKSKELTALEYMANAIDELSAKDNHGYETVIIDTTEDLFFMIQESLGDDHDVEFFSDIPHGQGWMKYRSLYTRLILGLKKLTLKKNMYIVYIIRAIDKTENKVTTKVPNINDKELNVINGNSDYRILCQKVGKNYIRRATLKRKNYEREKIADERILAILDTVRGAFEKSKKVTKEEQDKIAEEIESNEEIVKDNEDKKEDKPKGGDARPTRTRRQDPVKEEPASEVKEEPVKVDPAPTESEPSETETSDPVEKPKPRRRRRRTATSK